MLDHNFHLTTPRLYISHYNPSSPTHCAYVCQHIHSIAINYADPSCTPSPADLEIGRQFIADGAERMDRLGYGRYLISLRPRDGEGNVVPEDGNEAGVPFSEKCKGLEMIGTVSMQLARHANAPTIPDIGFGLTERHWGKGYATEAAQRLLKYYEDERGVRQVAGFCMPENLASVKVFRRLGFEERGVWDVDGVSWEGKILRVLVCTRGVGEGKGVLEGFGLLKVEGGGGVGEGS